MFYILTDKYMHIEIDTDNFKVKLRNKNYYKKQTTLNLLEDFIFKTSFN